MFTDYFGNWFSNWFGDSEEETPPTGSGSGGMVVANATLPEMYSPMPQPQPSEWTTMRLAMLAVGAGAVR